MNIGKFRFGGIHPHDNKDTADIHSSVFPNPKSVLITSAQHFGSPASIIKNKGDIVKKGDLIAKASADLSANVHASISGKISSIDIAQAPFGRSGNACLIQKDDSVLDNEYRLDSNYMSLNQEETLKRISEAGIVGLGGAMFPVSFKIAGAIKANCDTLIINAVECEPYITSDYRIMLEKGEEILSAIDIIRCLIPSIDKTYIGIENNKPLAIKEMTKLSKDRNICVSPLKVRYPQGAEKMLIDAITARVIPIKKLPIDVKVLVLNISTIYAIYEAVAKNKPLTERLVTITGNAIKEKKNLWIPFGTSINDISDFCGGITSEDVLIIGGGPMMGTSIPNTDRHTVKGINALLFLDNSKIKRNKEYPCISCDRCSNACPLKLVPTYIAHAAKASDKDAMNKYDIMCCFECGACSYVCPSKIELVQWIRVGKDIIRRS